MRLKLPLSDRHENAKTWQKVPPRPPFVPNRDVPPIPDFHDGARGRLGGRLLRRQDKRNEK